MSWQRVLRIDIPGNIIRDTFHPLYDQDTDQIIDTVAKGFVGTNLMVHNKGATAIVLSVNKQIVKEIPAGASFEWNDQNIGLVKIDGTGVFLYDALITGVTLDKLARLGVR